MNNQYSAVAAEPSAMSQSLLQAWFPLSASQTSRWFLYQLAPDNRGAHNTSFAARVHGGLDLPRMTRALQALVDRHPMLRTEFRQSFGKPEQAVMPSAEMSVRHVDMSGADAQALLQRVRADCALPFDLASPPLIRAHVYDCGEREAVLLVVLEHMACDGWSYWQLLEELGALLSGHTVADFQHQPQQDVSYAAYVHAQRAWLDSAEAQSQWNYWQNNLENLPVLQLPADRFQPEARGRHRDKVSLILPATLTRQLHGLGRKTSGTLYTTMMAAYGVLLRDLTGQDDIVIGTPMPARNRKELDRLVGDFVNPVPIRIRFAQEKSVAQLLRQVRDSALRGMSNQELPFSYLVERLDPLRDTDTHPIFQTAFIFQKARHASDLLRLWGGSLESTTVSWGRLELRPYPVHQSGGNNALGLVMEILEVDDGIRCDFVYDPALFDESTIVRWKGYFQALLENMVADDDQRIGQLLKLPEAERVRLLVEWNDTAAAYPSERCLHELFEAQAEANPDAIAAVFEDRQLSYRDLNVQANRLAHHLLGLGIVPDDRVALCVERSLDMVVGLLGILKAGAAYVPLDPSYPQDRLAYMLADCKPAVLVTQAHLQEGMCAEAACPVVHLDLDAAPLHDQDGNPNAKALGLTSRHLAYVIYTSGSTGLPKGVMVEHRGLTNLALAQASLFGIERNSRVLQFASFSFDASISECAMAWCRGAGLYLAPLDALRPGQPLLQTLQRHAITHVTLPSSVVTTWEDVTLPETFTLIVAGEACPPALTRQWAERIRLFNAYGPTETTVCASVYRCVPVTGAAVPIGRPMANTRIYLLDGEGRPVPTGVAGEVHIGGAGVARGYLNRPELTAEKFIADPFGASAEDRLYKTGDLARWLPGGDLEFLGRNDHQVKIRGFRIELGEIEHALTSQEAVKDAIVVAKVSAGGDRRLVAYVVSDGVNDAAAEGGHQRLIARWKQQLGHSLPEYMVPSAFVVLEKLPLTPNGKVDRKALPEPDLSGHPAEYVAPRTATEARLCEIWQDVLGVKRVGVTDNFFELGGHSLLATRLVSRINQVFDVVLPLKTLFATPLLEQLARAISTLEAGARRPALVSAARGGRLPLSYAQQRLWLLDQIDGGGAHYNMPGALTLSGSLDHEALNEAFGAILERHESLRTCFATGEDGQPYQVIQAAPAFKVPTHDISLMTEDRRQEKVMELANEEAARAFDLKADLMLRARLVKMAESEYVLLVTMHHIASDGWSMEILVNEFSRLYDACTRGQANPLEALAVQYADYAHWQRNWLQGEVLDAQLDYWEKQLAGLPAVHSLPLDHPRPQQQTFAGACHRSQIDTRTTLSLRTLCSAQGATLFMGLHAAFAALLSRYSNETDIVVGSPIANREQEEIAGLIGFFVNMLVLRSDLSQEPSFTALLDQSKAMLLDAYAHQQVPFEQIVERLQPERSLAHSALFQVMLVLQSQEQQALELSDLAVGYMAQENVVAKYDLTLNVIEKPEGLHLDWEFNTDLFDAGTIERMAAHFSCLLAVLVEAPEENVFKADILGKAERHRILVDWNDTAAVYPRDRCLHELFEAQVALNPDAVAIVFEDQRLSYGELNARANRLAHYLVGDKQVKPGTLVGICMERSLEMMIAILGILKAGGAYVPLDPAYPVALLAYMMDDAGLSLVLTQQSVQGIVPTGVARFCLDSQWSELDGHAADNPCACALPQHLAYVIYTSGSTGKPKGVAVPNTSITQYIQASIEGSQVTSDDVVLQFSSINFDASIEQIFSALGAGAALLIRGKEVWSAQEFCEQVKAHGISVADVSPAYLASLGELPTLRLLIVGGEAMVTETMRRIGLNCKCINAYGPTETTIAATTFCLNNSAHADEIRTMYLPIGRPVANAQAYILDRHLNVVPVGVAGELHIAGGGLAWGYLNRPDLTAEKFIPNPFAQRPGERMYKTGDWARYLPDGNIEFVGRIDHQVKIRGFRVELGEIEHALTSQEMLQDAIVLAKASAGADKRLVAYVVPAPGGLNADATGAAGRQALIAYLKQQLGQSLPEYMVPSSFVVLEKLPLTPGGKVDRKALPEPDLSDLQAEYVAPRTATEALLCQIWQDVLSVKRVGVNDNFFELGGHSLRVLQVIARLQKAGIEMAVRQLFGSPTLADLASSLDNGGQSTPAFQAPMNLIAEGCEHITPAMLPLVELSEEDIARIVAEVPGGAGNVQDIYPLGPLQEGILFHHMMNTQGDPYVLPVLLKITGEQALRGFMEALQFVVDRHDVLRTAVLWEGLPKAVQVVYRHAEVPVTWIELDDDQDALAHIQALCAPEVLQMNLSRPSLLQLQIARQPGSDQYFVLVLLHHIISDHVGQEIILGEIAQYQAGLGDRLPVPVPYREFVAHTRHQAGRHDAQAYFRAILGDVDEPTAPFNLTDVRGTGNRIDETRQIVPEATSAEIRRLARQMKISPATLFHAAWAMVVAACSGRDDVVFGTVVSGRLQGTVGAERMLGLFINTLPLRVSLRRQSAEQCVQQVHAALQELLPHEQASLALAQRCSALPSGTPLFSAMLNYRHSTPEVTTSESGSSTEKSADKPTGFEFLGGQERTNYPFNLSVDDLGGGFELDVQVDKAIGAQRVAGYMQVALANLVDALSNAPDRAISSLSILPDAERHRILADWNDTATAYPRGRCLHELFEAQVALNPDAVAIVFKDQQLSYGELNAQANRLAHYLVGDRQVKPGTLVGICMDRSLEMVVAILGILKAGGTYVPMGPECSDAHLAHVLDDPDLGLVITQGRLPQRMQAKQELALCLDEAGIKRALECQAESNVSSTRLRLTPNRPAYVICIQDPAGSFKKVAIEQTRIIQFLDHVRSRRVFTSADCLLATAATSFDIHGLELFLPLSNGAKLVVASSEAGADPAMLITQVTKHQVSAMQATPEAWSMLTDPDLKPAAAFKVWCGGEALSLPLARMILDPQTIGFWDRRSPWASSAFNTTPFLRGEHGKPRKTA